MTFTTQTQRDLFEPAGLHSSPSGGKVIRLPVKANSNPNPRRRRRRASSTSKDAEMSCDMDDSLAAKGSAWSPEEHERFLHGLERFPCGPWKEIAQLVGTRTVRQTMTHAQKYRQKIARRKRGLHPQRRKAETCHDSSSPDSSRNGSSKKLGADSLKIQDAEMAFTLEATSLPSRDLQLNSDGALGTLLPPGSLISSQYPEVLGESCGFHSENSPSAVDRVENAAPTSNSWFSVAPQVSAGAGSTTCVAMLSRIDLEQTSALLDDAELHYALTTVFGLHVESGLDIEL